jgi:hypothetical protein
VANELTDKLISNLKAFNAKERDHLLRFAYLGESGCYETSGRYLSEPFTEQLMAPDGPVKALGLNETAKCVFAAMDYHIDWLCAALTITVRKKVNLLDKKGEALDFELESEPVGQENISRLYTDFRPIMGNQEDIDLLAVFSDNEGKTVMLFIEAKGVAAFDRVQLARKMIRLDRVLETSGVLNGGEPLIRYGLVLISPKEMPLPGRCQDYVRELKGGKFERIHESCSALKSTLGEAPHVMDLKNFPRGLVFKVTRMGAKPRQYTRWGVVERK